MTGRVCWLLVLVRWTVAALVSLTLAACAYAPTSDVAGGIERVAVVADAGFVVVSWVVTHRQAPASVDVLRRDASAGACDASDWRGGDVVARLAGTRRSVVDIDVEAGKEYCYAVAAGSADAGLLASATVARPVERRAAPQVPQVRSPRELGVLVLDERGGVLPDASVTIVVRMAGSAPQVLRDRSDADGAVVMTVARERDSALAGSVVDVIVVVQPQPGDGTAAQVHRSMQVQLPATIVIDPRDQDTAMLDVVLTQRGGADNHLVQLVPADGLAVLSDALDASALPTRVRVSRGAWTAVVSGFRYPDDVGTQLWFDLLAERDGLVVFDTRDATSVTLWPRATLATSASIVSLFTCPMAQRPGLAIMNRYCLGDAELLLTPQPYRFEAQLRARVGPVDWIYTLETDERDLAAGDARHVLDLGGGAHLDARLEAVADDEGEERVTLRVSVRDDHGNALRSVLRREGGVSVEAPAVVRVLDPAGFVVSERSVAGNDLDGLSVPLPGTAVAGGYRVEVRYPIGPLASAPLGALLEVAAH